MGRLNFLSCEPKNDPVSMCWNRTFLSFTHSLALSISAFQLSPVSEWRSSPKQLTCATALVESMREREAYKRPPPSHKASTPSTPATTSQHANGAAGAHAHLLLAKSGERRRPKARPSRALWHTQQGGLARPLTG
jgi:hypothetical protein